MPQVLTRAQLLAFATLPLIGCGAPALRAAKQEPTITAGPARIAFSHPLPPLDGEHLVVTVVEVRYAPGAASTPHQHPCPVVGYILEGAFRSRVLGERETTYTAGQSFYESPNAVHQVSANASATAPVRFLASFTCDHETPLSVAAPEVGAGLGRQP